jgi:hypothetical protein
MTRIKFFIAVCFAVAIGFGAGRFHGPVPVKAAGLSYIVHVSMSSQAVIVPAKYGTPVALSCAGTECSVLTQAN